MDETAIRAGVGPWPGTVIRGQAGIAPYVAKIVTEEPKSSTPSAPIALVVGLAQDVRNLRTPSESTAGCNMSDSLVSKLCVPQNNFVALLIALSYLNEFDPAKLAEDRTVIVKPDGMKVVRGQPKPGQVTEGVDYVSRIHVGTPEGRNRLLNDPASGIIRSFVIESFEIVKDHCDDTGWMDQLHHEPWFHYVRFVRNALTHNRHWVFRQNDKAMLPISWNGRTIEASMEGQEITGHHADWYQALEMHTAMVKFAETLP